MRIFTLLAFSIFISSISSAQQKGDLFIGGTIGFSDYKTATNDQAQRQKNFYVDPTIGKFYANNRMAGINVGYSYSRFRDSLRSYSLKAGVFLRQYQPLGKSFYLFADEGINGYMSRYNEGYDEPAEIKTRAKSISLDFYPGIAYALNKRFQLEIGLPYLFSIYYSHSNYKNELSTVPQKRKSNYFAVSTGLNDSVLGNLSFGVRWVPGKN